MTLHLTPASTRELVHLLILQELAEARPQGGVIVKGGVNLRLFFESRRYSEDMDLDGHPDGSDEIRRCITRLFDDRDFTRRVQAFGIRELDPGQGPNKDTETTFRYKFGVFGGGGVRYPTKVEVSFREHDEYRGQVLEFLEEAERETQGTEDAWDAMCLQTAALMDAILDQRGRE